MSTPKDKYADHRKNAAKRSIPFLLTFDEWWDIWQQSGHWNERGTKQGQYCMSRNNDIGPYAVGNVFIQLHSQNSRDGTKHPNRHSWPKGAGSTPAADIIKRADKIARNWEFIDPVGNKHIVHNASAFCRLHNLSEGAISAVASGNRTHHKGWTCKRLP